MVRREAAAEVGYLDPDFFVYYDECDFCKRLADAGWHTLFVPAAEAVHHDQLSTDLAAGLPRIVEFHRNRDLYMRKHHSRPAALAVRVLTAWSYALRALAATVLPGQPAPRSTGPTPARRSSRAAARASGTAPPGVELRARASSSIRIGLVGLGDRARRPRPARRAGAATRSSSSPGGAGSASQRRSSAVKKPLARRASG